MQEGSKFYNNVKPATCWQRLFPRSIDYNDLLDRTIVSNVPDPQLPNNRIDTAKYNIFTFLPLDLLLQFTKPSNVYFLLIGVLQTIPVISLSEGQPTIFLPLFVVVAISMVKDFLEDLKRRKNDQKENSSQVECLTAVGFAIRRWEDLRVGQIIRVRKDQYFPCDVVLLDYPVQHPTAFIETKNLDGETNLKLKKACQHLQNLRGTADLDLQSWRAEFSFEKPNPFLSTFNGNVKRKHMIDVSSVVLRGCSLKINEWAIGMCLYTGHQTKILLNSGTKQNKLSTLQDYLNSYFKYIFAFQITVTLLSSIIYGVLIGVHEDEFSYLQLGGNVPRNIVFTWGSWFISFSNFIPISLIVTVEIVRYGQGMLLSRDPRCKARGVPAEVQTSNINEELGQVKYILSDKTGTLTQNQMEFKCVYINGKHYGHDKDEVVLSQPQQESHRSFIKDDNRLDMSELKKQSIKVPHVDFPPSEKDSLLNDIAKGGGHGSRVRDALLHLAICHNVIPEKNNFTSSSPDEVALVSFTKYIGYQFTARNDRNELQIVERSSGKCLRYELLHILEFSSDRKRMSVLIKDLNKEEQPIVLLSKGADEIVLARITQTRQEKQRKEEIMKVLYDYACQGLRTLVLAEKYIDLAYYQDWDKRYCNALATLGPQRTEMMESLQEQIERNWQIVGATAIEDKLQPQVKSTICDLKRAGMKVWMLTGDKKETAISIGFSTGLIEKNTERIVLDCDAEHAKALLTNLTSMLHLINNKKVTIFSGDFIRKIDPESLSYLENILQSSESVICCRVSPKDKQQIARLVGKWGVVLAIGDGANDVNMINCANVGVGVRGIQGSQATRAADYVVSEFKVLSPLVLFHGLNFYHRNCNVMVYTLYKNMLLTLPNLLYGALSLESGAYIYDIWAVQLFNIFYAFLPIFYYGLCDTKFSDHQARTHSWCYPQGQQSRYFNRRILVTQLLKTISLSALLLYVVYYSTEGALSGRGLGIYGAWSGNLILAIVVWSCNIRIITMSNQFNLLQGLFVSFGVLFYYLSYYLIGIIFDGDSTNNLAHQMSTPLYWLLLFFLTFLVEAIEVYFRTMGSLARSIARSRVKRIKPAINQEVELAQVRELSVHNDEIVENSEMGGYAFAEDDNRLSITSNVGRRGRARSLSKIDTL